MVLFSGCNYFYYNYYIISIKKVKSDNLRPLFQQKEANVCHQPLSYRSFFLLSKMNTLPMTYYLQPSLPIHHYHLHSNHLVLLCSQPKLLNHMHSTSIDQL